MRVGVASQYVSLVHGSAGWTDIAVPHLYLGNTMDDSIYIIQIRNRADMKPGRVSNVGWYHSFELAEKALMENPEVLSDNGIDRYALIERSWAGLFSAGLQGDDDDAVWYRMDDSGKYARIDNPIPGVVGFTVG